MPRTCRWTGNNQKQNAAGGTPAHPTSKARIRHMSEIPVSWLFRLCEFVPVLIFSRKLKARPNTVVIAAKAGIRFDIETRARSAFAHTESELGRKNGSALCFRISSNVFLAASVVRFFARPPLLKKNGSA